MDSGLLRDIGNQLLDEANASDIWLTFTFDRYNEAHRVKLAALHWLQDEGWIDIQRETGMMISYSITDAGRRMVQMI